MIVGGAQAGWRSLRWLGWLSVVTLALFVNVLPNGFVWDDRAMLQTGAGVSPASGRSIAEGGTILQRPATALSFRLDHLLYGGNPAGYHLTNLLLHLGVVLLFAGLARALLRSERSAVLASTLFVLHPIHSEAVAALLGRSDLLVGVFSLLALWAYRKPQPILAGALAVAFSFLALASKESGLAALGLAIWFDLCFRRREGRRLLLRWLPFLLMLVVVVPCYLWLLSRNPWFAVARLKWWGGSPLNTFLMMATVAWEYGRLLFFPLRLSPWYVTPGVTTFLHGKVVAGLILVIGVILLLAWSFKRRPTLSFGLGWILIFLLPVSNLIPIPGSMMAERWLYLSSLGFCLVAGMGLNRFWELVVAPRAPIVRFGGIAIGILLALGMGWQTIEANRVWRNNETLFLRVIERFPESFKGHANLGKAFLDQGRLGEARSELLKAVALKPDSPFPFHWLGEVYLREGKGDSARGLFCESIRQDSTFYPAYLSLGGVYQRVGMADSALAVYRAALRHIPTAELYNQVGILLVAQRDMENGIKAYEQAIRVNPRYGPAYHNLGNVLLARGDSARAEEAYRRALQADPTQAESHHALALLYLSQGRPQEAVRELEQAVRKRPNEVAFAIALARAQAAAGDIGRALETYDMILNANPSLTLLEDERDSLRKRLSSDRP